jgi:SagB-type dehydrogenase family enzyme
MRGRDGSAAKIWLVARRAGAPDELAFRHPGGKVAVGHMDGTVVGALARLEEGATEDSLLEGVLEPAWLFYALRVLGGVGALTYSVRSEGRELARMERMAHGPAPSFPVVPDTRVLALSRFALQRRQGSDTILESPRSVDRILLTSGEARAIVGHLSRSASLRSVVEESGVEAHSVERVMALLIAAGMVVDRDDGGSAEEDEAAALRQWSSGDLYFHTRSRTGRHDGRMGATHPFLGRAPPLPVVKPPMSGRSVALHRPDMARVRAGDRDFTSVLEARRSVRDYDEAPITAEQLGEFLYRAARIRSVREAGSESSYATSSRPYPGGGACYELEIYPAVARCDGLDPGFYHYDPQAHRLELLPADDDLDVLFAHAGAATGAHGPRQIVLVISARFGRVMWKYEGIAYSIILKDVGVLLQTFYLVATSMGLAPCAIGSGDVELFRSLTGLPIEVESSVGEFMLGSLPR